MPDTDYKYTVSALGYIQDIIKRMASNSLFIKGWALSLSAILVAFIPKMNTEQPKLSIIIITLLIVIIVVFSLLDAYYLKQERLFRNEYNRKVNLINDDEIKESLKIISLNMAETCYCSVYFSVSIIPYYLILILSLIFGSILI